MTEDEAEEKACSVFIAIVKIIVILALLAGTMIAILQKEPYEKAIQEEIN